MTVEQEAEDKEERNGMTGKIRRRTWKEEDEERGVRGKGGRRGTRSPNEGKHEKERRQKVINNKGTQEQVRTDHNNNSNDKRNKE